MNCRFQRLRLPFVCSGALVLALLAGCGRNDVQVYRVSKEQPPAPATGQDTGALPPGHPDLAGAASDLQWKLPAGWEEVPAGQMRRASFRVQGQNGKIADVGVFPPGIAGRDVDNVNRWRGQLGLAPVSEEELAKQAQPVEIAGQSAQLYDLAGESGAGEKNRILAAILHRDSGAWFFKMMGDDELVAQQKPAFVTFLKSVTFSAATAQAGLPASHPPMDSSGLLSATAGDSAAQGKPAWQVPAGWQEVPAGQFLVAKFAVSGSDSSPTAVNISTAPGEGGGVSANVNRWRKQLGLAELGETELNKTITSVDTAGGKAMLVDMSGTDARTGQKARLVGAIVPQSGQTWFYKLMGNEQVVGREKDAFEKFIQSAKY